MSRMNTGDERSLPSSRWWSVAVAGWLAAMFITGGTSKPDMAVLVAHALAGTGIAAVAAWRLRLGFPTWVGAAGAVLLTLALALVLLQLVPLPPGLWANLPGRDLTVRVFELANQPLPWLPLNMQPAAGYTAALALVPAIAGYLAVLTLDERGIAWLVASLLLCALGGVFLALLQIYAGPGGSFDVYESARTGNANGLFSNRNFFAAQLFAAVPFLVAFSAYVSDRWRVKPWITTGFATIYTGVLLAGLAAAGSRGGVLLSILSVFLSFALVLRWRGLAHSGSAALVALAGLFVIGQASMVGILRLVADDPLEDFRSTIFAVSLRGAEAFFPAGSGFGSFVSSYQMFEQPADIIDAYVNHAHNDWLEVAFEGGLPAILLLGTGVVLLVIAGFRLFRMSMFGSVGVFFRAGAVAALLLMLHASVDFGLRTPALTSLLAVSLGLVTLAGASLPRRHHQQYPAQAPTPAPDRNKPRPFVPGAFGSRKKPVEYDK